MASFTFTPHQMVRSPATSVPHPQQLLQARAENTAQARGLDPVNPTQDPVPVQSAVAPSKSEFANPQHAQAAVLANAQAPTILRRADAPEPYDLTAPPPAPEAGYIDEFFDLSALPDGAPAQSAETAYDKSRGLFGAPNQKFGRF